MEWMTHIQWPAMAITVAAAWLIGEQRKGRRQAGFWCFLMSNVLWVAWGWHSKAWALIVLQVCLAGINIRGARKNDTDSAEENDSPPDSRAAHTE